jgi:tRNA(Ile)-lysidine synthase
MHHALLKYIQRENLFKPKEKILLAVSGGVDSVVLCDLFHAAGMSVGIAHCNFNLRAAESDGDEQFVKELAANYKTSFHHIRFDTDAYAKKNKVSIQVAARELRYEWFEKIRTHYNYNYIATAHHQGDVIETFFINLIRGTGISGLRSIVPKQGNIIRPLLFATKKSILAYAEKNKITYREDSSNASDKYLRNKIRHHLLPVLNELSPVAETAIVHSIEKLREAEFIYKKAIEDVHSKLCIERGNTICMAIPELKKLNPVATYLYELLKPYGFNAASANDIINVLSGESGKQFLSSTHRLIKDRDFLIIEPLTTAETGEEYLIEKDQVEFKIPGSELNLYFQFTTPEYPISNAISTTAIDLAKLNFPLTIRKWKVADVFHPLGMKGKKKLSDFFIDKKLSLIEKENTWLLCSDETIVWVIGMRLDDRFKVNENTKKMVVIELAVAPGQ